MTGWMAFAAAMLVAPVPPQVTAHDVIITAVSPRPPLSGVLRTFLIFDVRIGGRAERLYQTYVYADQFVPTAGAHCTVTFHEERFDRVPDDRAVRDVMLKIVDQISCGTGRDSQPRRD